MSASPLERIRSLWSGLSPTRRVAAVITVLYALAAGVEAAGVRAPGMGLLRFVFSWALFIWFLMFLGWVRRRLLWGLRNRLLVAYLFIAVVPILLVVAMAGISAFILYGQLGSYVLSQEVSHTLGRMEALAETAVADSGLASPPTGRAARQNRPSTQQPAGKAANASLLAAAPREAREALGIPGLEVLPGQGEELLPKPEGNEPRHFSGLIQQGEKLWLRTVVERRSAGATSIVSVSVPVTPELLDRWQIDLGTIRCDVLRPETPSDRGRPVIRIDSSSDASRAFVPLTGISSRHRTLPPPAHWFDMEIAGFSKFDSVSIDAASGKREMLPVFVAFTARPSQLNRQLFSSLGNLSGVPLYLLVVVGILFLIIEAAALVTGVVLTRTITRSVSDLYSATLHVQSGDLSHRIRNIRNDQLGALASSFNEMTASVARSIEEQRQRQRLENELAIAREVQNQLFPRTIPRVPGLHLVASCRAARVVSGDYYDFIALDDDHLALVVADIAGKGISAALLMAGLQSAVRSQLIDGGRITSTAAVVSRLNHHLLATTPDDRFATLFFAIYSAQDRTLRYTNAGHLPPFYFNRAGVSRLETGGTVVGMFPEWQYEEAVVSLDPGSLILAYSDGITEPENVYGEQFGHQRVIEEVQRNRAQRPEAILNALSSAVDQWTGTPEQSDDMTIVLASVTA